jgi:Ca2+-transporting ATPase
LTIGGLTREPEHGTKNAPALDTSSWHRMTVEKALAALGTPNGGLDEAEALARLERYGANVLGAAKRRSIVRMIADQFTDVLVIVLLASAVVSGFLGDLKDTIVILAIVVLDAIVGVVQEYRAERALDALRTMAAPTALVLRGGTTKEIAAARLVPGDVVLLSEGRIVPADLRVCEAAHLEVDESLLTGESFPVAKTAASREEHAPAIGDRANETFQGTRVTRGRARALVVATGRATEFGRIAGMLESATVPRTPLQRRLDRFAARLALVVVAICAIAFGVGWLRGEPALLMFLTAVSLAVAAVPEALPAVVTISLALGARRLVARSALVRSLPAVETLGSVTVVCTDKTGTITLNRMTVTSYWVDGMFAAVPGEGKAWRRLTNAMTLCSDAREDPSGAVSGDPTDVALYEAARAAGVRHEDLAAAWPRIDELPFESARRRATTIHAHSDRGGVAVMKGAPEVVLARCAVFDPAAGQAADAMAAKGLRVLALASRRWPAVAHPLPPDEVEEGVELLGLVGISDPPRVDAKEAVAACRAAGIAPVMITGDHPLTARSIATEVGILDDGGEVVTGSELAAMGPDDLACRAGAIRVYARVAPEQKLAIVEALQRRGEIVAMTGDGVNDAPALRRADIGVAMGITGTDVAKEAAAMVLLDDRFATIVGAVREGRKVYDNIRKFIRYVLTTNAAEVWTILLAPFVGMPIPLLPIQILWINLVTDGLPGLAFAAELEEPDVMERPPRAPAEGIFARGLGLHALWVGLLMAGVTLGAQAWLLARGDPNWRTMVFTILCWSQLAHAMAIRSERCSLFTQGAFTNRPMIAAVALAVVLQTAVVYLPWANATFATTPLPFADLSLAVAASLVVFVAVELEKLVRRRKGWV